MPKKRSIETNRVKLLKISAEIITAIYKRAVENKLPKDASVVRVSYNSLSNTFDVIVHSKEFPEILEGSMILEVDESPVVSSDVLKYF